MAENSGEAINATPNQGKIEEVVVRTSVIETKSEQFFVDRDHFKDTYGVYPSEAPSEVVKMYVDQYYGFKATHGGEKSRITEREMSHYVIPRMEGLKMPS